MTNMRIRVLVLLPLLHVVCFAPTHGSDDPFLTGTASDHDSTSVVVHGNRHEKVIALTFDACSTHQPSHYDERVTETLIRTKTPATIFLGGKWIEDFPDHARFLAKVQFFELGNHSYYHPHLTNVPDSVVRTELQRTQDTLFAITGMRARFFRPPYGEYDNRLVRLAAQLGLTTVEYVTAKTRNGSIIVMHINARGWHTAEALPDILADLRQGGFRFVTMSELLHLVPTREE